MKHQAELTAIAAAEVAAAKATQAMIDENPNVWYPCGFAWVVIKPARGPLVAALKEANAGRTSEMGGFVVYNPSGNPTQWMDAKHAGANAFKNVLREFLQAQPDTYPKYKLLVETRID